MEPTVKCKLLYAYTGVYNDDYYDDEKISSVIDTDWDTMPIGEYHKLYEAVGWHNRHRSGKEEKLILLREPYDEEAKQLPKLIASKYLEYTEKEKKKRELQAKQYQTKQADMKRKRDLKRLQKLQAEYGTNV